MSEAEDRKVAADVIRGIGAGVGMAVSAAVPGAGAMFGLGVDLIAQLVETLGVDGAHEALKKLAENPAKLITRADLDAQTAAVKRAYGVGGDGDGA